MARTTAWESHMRRAAEQLSRACEEAAARMSGGETAVKEIKELSAAMKELTALYAARKKANTPQVEKRSTIRVRFDRSGKTWRQ